MHALILATAMLGQYMMPSLPAFDPAGYHRRFPEYIGPAGPSVGEPKLFTFPYYALVGNVESVDRKRHLFIMRTPVERLEVHYTRQTMWVNVGHLQPDITLAVDLMTKSITFLPKMTLKQIAANVPQTRTGYEDAP